jgi:hypothetical protein
MTFSTGSGHDEPAVALTGRTVVDSHLARVGKVTDVLADDRVAARWAVVKTGVLSGEHFMPLEASYVDTAGRLVAPLSKSAVKRAPRVRSDHVLTIETRRKLRDYYNIAA